ncbi:MAG: LamG domain-containing protein, partial [Sedimentisphaerales bacterium]|nr:LamG domain-containing protein [Sedimentisphaerales bacterium]
DTPVLTEPTDFGNAMFFDSEQGQWIDCGTDTNFSLGGNHPKTATAWVHTRRFNNGGIFEYGEHNDGQNFALRTLSSAVDSWRVQYWGDYDIDFTFPSLNAWVHFALVHDAQRTKVYANSQLIVDEARTLNTNDQANFEIGRYDVSNFFHGVIDDVRLYSRALTKQDILDVAQIHNAPPTADAGPDLRLIQEIGDSDTIAITEAVVTDIPGDITITWSLLSGPGAIEFDDAGIANPTITFDGVSFGFYHLQLLVEDNQNTEWTATDDMYIMYQEKDLYGLVGLWTLDEETGLVAPDTSGNGLDGTLAAVPREGVEDPNVPVWQPTLGKIDGAVQCINTGENIDQYVDLSRVPGTDDITLMFWAKPDVVANMQVLDKMPYTTPAGNAGWSARLRSDGTAQFRIGDDHDNFTNVDAANAYQAGQWTHIAMTFDSAAGEGRVYVNGLQGAVGTTTHTINTLYPPVQLGLPAMTDTNDKYRGLVDQVRIYDRALSPLEVARQAIADALEIDGCQLSIPGVRMTGDLNEDCFVDLLDFNLMAGEWLDCTDLNVDACWQ